MGVERCVSGGASQRAARRQRRVMQVPLDIFVGLGKSEVNEVERILTLGSRQTHDEVAGLDISVDVASAVHQLDAVQLERIRNGHTIWSVILSTV